MRSTRPTGRRRHADRRSGSRQRPGTSRVTSAARFAERARRRRLRPLRLLGVVVVVAAVVGAVAWVLVGSPWFRVQRVDVVGASPHRETYIQDLAGPQLGKPLVEVDLQRVADDVNQDNYFASVEASRSWPQALSVRVQERVPAVAVRLDNGEYRLVDREGVAFEKVGSAPADVLVAQLESPADQRSLATAAAVGDALPASVREQVEAFEVDSGARARFAVEGVEVVWGAGVDSGVKAAVLEPLLKRGGVARIDVTAPMSPVTSKSESR